MSSGNPSQPASGGISSEPTKSAAAKSSFGPARIILLVVLLGAVGVLAWDYMARSKFNAAQEAANELGELPAAGPKEVEEKMGRAPDESSEDNDGKTRSDLYRFSTAFYVYTIDIQYRAIGTGDNKKWMFSKPVVENDPRFW